MMANKIDEMLASAQKALEQSTEADKASNEAYLNALKAVKDTGVEAFQDDVNSIAKTEREKEQGAWREVLGMSREEASEILESLNDEELQGLLPEANAGDGEGEEGEEGESMSDRMKAALRERDSAIESERERITSLSQKLHAKEVESGLKDALRQKGLKDGRFDLARKLSGESDLVQTLMDGKELEQDAFSKAAESLYEASPEWFSDGSESGNGGGDQTIGDTGLKLRQDSQAAQAAGIPPTPTGNGSTALTDAQRAERTTNVY